MSVGWKGPLDITSSNIPLKTGPPQTLDQLCPALSLKYPILDARNVSNLLQCCTHSKNTFLMTNMNTVSDHCPCCITCHQCGDPQFCHLCDGPSSYSRYNLTKTDWGRVTSLSPLDMLFLIRMYLTCNKSKYTVGSCSVWYPPGPFFIRVASQAISFQDQCCVSLFEALDQSKVEKTKHCASTGIWK